MKGVVYTKYGPPDVLKLQELDKPVPTDSQVLVKIHAASINSWDWDMVRGKPVFVRMWGMFKPKYRIPGADIAGRVEAIGKSVTHFQPGDDVFGDLCACGWGGFAEYVCAPENVLTLKSPRMTFEEAAAFPQAAAMALQSIRDKGQVKPGDKVLINGAGGGVGTFAVQIAKSYGAEVTGVDRADKLDMLLSIGADNVIDYAQDFVENRQRYDLIVDVVANRSIFVYKRALNSEGMFIMVGGTTSAIIQCMLFGPLISKIGTEKLGILAHKPNKDLDFLNELYESGKVLPVIDKRYRLREAAEAFGYYAEGHVKGKVIITVHCNDKP